MFPSKPTAASSLLALLLATGTSASTNRNILGNTLACINDALPPHAPCADRRIIHRYLDTYSPSLDGLVVDIQIALYNAGCTDMEEARSEAEWAVEQCSHHLGDARADLRRVKRADETTENTAKTTSTDTKATTTTAGLKTVILTTHSTTDSVSSTSTTPSTTVSATPSICFTTSMKAATTCPLITTGASSGKVGSCFPTTTPTSVCASGLICRTDTDGNPSCMYAQTKLSTAGIVISIFFGAAVTLTASLMIFFSCREKRQQKALARVREAEAIALEAALAKKGPLVRVREVSPGALEEEDGRPLMGAADMGYSQDPFRDEANRTR